MVTSARTSHSTKTEIRSTAQVGLAVRLGVLQVRTSVGQSLGSGVGCEQRHTSAWPCSNNHQTTQKEHLMHKFDRAVATVVTGLHAVSAVDMAVR